jgi:excisionase family DNA binding protein
MINNEIVAVAVNALKNKLAVSSCQSPTTQKEKLISVKETAEILNCCTKTVYRLVEKGVLRKINCGTNSVRFKESDVLMLVNNYHAREEEVIPGDK